MHFPSIFGGIFEAFCSISQRQLGQEELQLAIYQHFNGIRHFWSGKHVYAFFKHFLSFFKHFPWENSKRNVPFRGKLQYFCIVYLHFSSIFPWKIVKHCIFAPFVRKLHYVCIFLHLSIIFPRKMKQNVLLCFQSWSLFCLPQAPK